MDTDLSSLLGQRYIYFSTLQSNNTIFSQLYQDASTRLNSIGSALGSSTINESQKSDTEKEFRFKIVDYLSMLKAMSTQLQNNEQAFIASQIPLLKKAKVKPQILNTIKKLGTGEITNAEYQDIISLINTIRYGGDLKKIRTIIKEQKNNLEHMQANLKLMENEQGGTTNKTADLKEMERIYVENYNDYKKDFAGKLMRAVRDQEKYHTATLMDRYTRKVNSILGAIGRNAVFIEFVQNTIKNQPEDKTIVITEHEVFNRIFEEAILEAENEKNNGKQGRTIAKKIIQKITGEINSGQISGSTHSEYANIIKGSKRQVSIEEIAISNGSQGTLADAINDASNAIEIIEKFSDDTSRNENLENWKRYKELASRADEEGQKLAKSAKTKFNKGFKASVLQSNTAQEMQKQLGTVKGKQKRQIISKLTDTLELAFAKPLPRLDGSLEKLCTLTLSKSSLAEVVAAHQNEIVNIITNKLPGTSINLKDDIFYAFRINSDVIHNRAEKKSKQMTTEFESQVNHIIEDTFGSFMQKYHDMTGGETDVEAANIAYMETMKKMVSEMESLMQNLELTDKEQQVAWEELSNTFISSISVKEYTLYNDTLGYHGGSLGGGGSPESVVNNINRMYELGGISPLDRDELLFAILNCAPSAIGSSLKTNLESYLLGGAALVMFDEGFTASQDYLEKMHQELNVNSLPRNLNLYFLNGIYIPASYIIYNIYQSLSIFYSHLDADIEAIKTRNRVVITNNANLSLINKSKGATLAERFQATAEAAMGQINIQFLFMAGMLDILTNLNKVFNVK